MNPTIHANQPQLWETRPKHARTGLPGELALGAAGLVGIAQLLAAVVLEHRGQPGLAGAARLAVGPWDCRPPSAPACSPLPAPGRNSGMPSPA